jgi:hypothetical protein
VSTAGVANTITGLATGSKFTNLTIQNGNAAAYLVAAAPGSYGASWNQSSGAYCSTTAAFKGAN